MKTTRKEELMALVSDFAKANKVGKGKVEAFVNEVLSQVNGNRGKPVSQESLVVRDKLRALDVEGNFTAKDIAKRINEDHVTVLNNLRYLMENEGMFTTAGYQEKQKGGRGRPSVLWTKG